MWNTTALLTLFGGGLTLAVAAWMMVAEIGPYRSSGAPDESFFAEMVVRQPTLPLSVSGASAILERCESMNMMAYAFMQPEQERHAAAKHCRDFAHGIVAGMPSFSYAWYVSALWDVELEEFAQADIALQQSWATGPLEQWIAERRVNLGETILPRLSLAARDSHDADLLLLAQSNRGVRSIAQRYVADPSFRDRITLIVEQLPDSQQRRFLARVRDASRASGV